MHDALTQLPNRRALDALMQRDDPLRDGYTIIRIDLDLFKQVNDTMAMTRAMLCSNMWQIF